jgi:predicted MFS family arabinose efflux permease
MFTHIVDFMIIMPLGPQLMKLFDISPGEFSLLVASYTITAGVTGFFAAFLIDRFDRRHAMLFVYSGFALGTLACAYAPSYHFLLITRSLTGGFGGVLGALVLSIVSDAVPLERRASGMGTVMASFGLASVAGVPFGLFIASKSSWHAPFLFLGLLSLAIAALIYFYIPSMDAHVKEKHASPFEVLSTIFGNANARSGLLFSSLLMMGHFTIIPFVAPYMVGNVGFNEVQVALIYLVGGACTLFFSPWVGKMADKHGRLKIFTLFGTLVLIPVAAITNLPPVPIWAALIVTAAFFIFSNGRMVPSTTMETAVIRPENRGSYMSIRSSVQQLTSGLASFVAGLIIVERPPIFGTAKSLGHYEYVGVIAITFSLLALVAARRLTVVQGS